MRPGPTKVTGYADPVGHFGIGFDTGAASMTLNGLDLAAPVRCGVGPPV